MGTPHLPTLTRDGSASDDAILEPFRSINVIALDVDGTLLAEDESIVSSEIIQLHCALASHPAPIDFVLVTGRPWEGVKHLVRSFEAATGRRSPHVVHFGSVVTDAAGSKALRRSAIPAQIVRSVVDIYLRCGLAPSVIQCDAELSETHWSIGEAEPAGLDPQKTYGFGVPVRAVPELPGGVEAQVILAKTQPDVAARVLRELARLETKLPMEYHKPSGVLYVDSQGSSKADGLLFALKEMGVSPERAIAVGDATPDIAMFETVRLGVAVSTADAEVIEAADYVSSNGCSAAVVEVLGLLLAARGDVTI